MNGSQATSAADLLSRFCGSMTAENKSDRTVLWYVAEVRAFFGWLQANNLHTGDWVQRDVIERYLADCRRKGNAPATVAGRYRALHGWFRWLTERGYTTRSPMEGMKPPKVPRKVPRRAAPADYKRLLDSIPAESWVQLRDRLIVNVLFLCGLRRAEIVQLQADDFRMNEHLLIVRKGKGGNSRFVPLLKPVEEAFVAYVYVRPAWNGEGLLLSADGGGNPTGILTANGLFQMVRRRCAAAGMKNLSPHAWRHGLAMHLLNEGGDMSLVQKVLGHSQISTTAKHYAEWMTGGMQREFAVKMGEIGK